MEGAADGVVVLQLLPGVVLSLLVAQRDLVVLGVDVKLLDVDFDKKRISLSMKALLNDDAE